jgi:integrase/recombinase XerD
MKLTGDKGVLAQFLMDCESRLADSSVVLYRRDLGLLVRFLGDKGITELESVTIADLREFIHFLSHAESNRDLYPHARHRLERCPSPVTIASYVRIIKAFFSWCVKEELLEKNPAVRLAKPKTPERVVHAFTPEHIARMLATCDTSTELGFRDYVILIVLLDTGMRVSELVGLSVQNVYPRYIKVFGKGQKEREIGMHPEVGKLLWKYIQKYRSAHSDEERVFLGRKGPLTVQGVEQIFQRVSIASGIEGVRISPHTMRHTFSKYYLKNGGDLFKLSRELGHSDVQVTGRVYLGDFKSSEAREDHESFSPAVGMGAIKSKKSNQRK